MKILKVVYEKVMKKNAPYWLDYGLWTNIKKPFRKYFTNVVAANCPFKGLRLWILRRCGFKIGKNVFIGMKCYLDDMCYDMMEFKDGCTVSYGVYFACHGRKQNHLPIIVEEGAYIGMRASVITKGKDGMGVTIGKNAIVGACTLVNKSVPDNCTAVGVPCRIIENNREVAERN